MRAWEVAWTVREYLNITQGKAKRFRRSRALVRRIVYRWADARAEE